MPVQSSVLGRTNTDDADAGTTNTRNKLGTKNIQDGDAVAISWEVRKKQDQNLLLFTGGKHHGKGFMSVLVNDTRDIKELLVK